jgi:hypothetical protein
MNPIVLPASDGIFERSSNALFMVSGWLRSRRLVSMSEVMPRRDEGGNCTGMSVAILSFPPAIFDEKEIETI